jgi:hypothetical protein
LTGCQLYTSVIDLISNKSSLLLGELKSIHIETISESVYLHFEPDNNRNIQTMLVYIQNESLNEEVEVKYLKYLTFNLKFW